MIDIPSRLSRFFRMEDHALQFIRGHVRFGLLTYYRNIEGVRRDDQEGLVSFYWDKKAPQIEFDIRTGRVVRQSESDQNIRYTGSSLNARFILCTSHAEAKRRALAEKFGRFVVCIGDPKELLRRIKIAWGNHPWALDGDAFIAPVTYNKGEVIAADPNLIAPPHYSYAQKPRSFENEMEFRYILTCSVDTTRVLPDFVILSLANCEDILHLPIQVED